MTMIENAHMQTAYMQGMQEKKQFSWEKQTQVMTKLRTFNNSEDFLAGRPAENCEFNPAKKVQ